MRPEVRKACEDLLHAYENNLPGPDVCDLCNKCYIRSPEQMCSDCPWVNEVPPTGSEFIFACNAWYDKVRAGVTCHEFRLYPDKRPKKVLQARLKMIRKWLA